MRHSRDTIDPGKPKGDQLKHDTPPTNTSHDNHPGNSHLEADDNTN